MPIQFVCPHCDAILTTARRKAGTEVACPTCKGSFTAPREGAGAVSAPSVRRARAIRRKRLERSGALRSRREQGEEAAARGAIPTPPAPPPPAPPRPAAVVESAPAARRGPIRSGVVLFGAAALFFAAGFACGRYFQTSSDKPVLDTAEEVPVLVDGKLVYHDASGRLTPDAGAVALLIPADADLSGRLPVTGLRPQDLPPSDSQSSLVALREAGGHFVKADAVGEIGLRIPRPGVFHVLLISAHARRANGEPVDELDRDAMRVLLSDPDRLISNRKYAWLEAQEVRIGQSTIEHDFGESEAKLPFEEE